MSGDGLAALTRETPADAERFRWLEQLRTELASVPRERRHEAVAAAARDLSAHADAGRWAGLFAEIADPYLRHLALALVAWLPVPLDPNLVAILRPLLTDKRIPGEVRLDAATALLQTTGLDGPAAEEVIGALLTRTGKARSVDRLRQLMQRLGQTPALDQLRAKLEEQVRMRCPRCRVMLRRPEMAQHVWQEHGVVLDGRSVREPWGLVAEWIEEYRRWGDRAFLDRCRDLGRRLDGENGLRRVHRLFLAHGLADAEAAQALRDAAGLSRSALCPQCYAFVPVPGEAALQPLNESHGRLSKGGYAVEVSERGLVPWLEITTPQGLLFRGREPDRRLTRRGAVLLLAGPPVLLALVGGILGSAAPLLPVAVPLAAALAVALGIWLYWLGAPSALERAADQAWARLVPHLGIGSLSAAESDFLSGLALTSLRCGTPAARQPEVQRLLEQIERAVQTGRARPGHLAALHRLAVFDVAAAGDDVVPLLVQQVRRCFVGELPLSFADELLRAEYGRVLTRADEARLSVLLCDAAFEVGLEVPHLLQAGSVAPCLGAVLGTDRRGPLAQLRLLWSLRPNRPWRRWGDARTAFELATDPAAGAEQFAPHPNVLLADLELPWIHLTGAGLVFREVVFAEKPSRVEVQEQRTDRGEFHLLVGDQRFAFWNDPTPVRVRLAGWFRFWFDEFLPRVPEVFDWQPPGPPRILDAQEALACPQCSALMWARVGDVGRAVAGRW